MTVLQQDPASISHRTWYDAAGMHFLALAHRDRTASWHTRNAPNTHDQTVLTADRQTKWTNFDYVNNLLDISKFTNSLIYFFSSQNNNMINFINVLKFIQLIEITHQNRKLITVKSETWNVGLLYTICWMFILIDLDLASRSMFSVGSEPIDKKQVIGILGSLSIHNASISRITPSAYYNTVITN